MKAEELHKLIGIMNTKINDIIGQGTKGVHFGGDRELFAAVASIEELYDLSYAPEAEIKKAAIMNILINDMLEGRSTRQICQSLKDKGLNDEDAWKVARNEVHRIKNLADWYQYYGAGYKFFSVKFEKDVCKKCRNAYDNNKQYSIEQLDMLPPFHGECRCSPVFQRK
jgi:hypothetical protein